ncbi:MAG: IS200/IS605 family transposase [Verrucomicrobiota bacterium]
MGQSLSKVVIHIVFSTKDREPFLDESIRDDMFRYLAVVCRGVGGQCYRVGGVADHVHLVTSLPRTVSQSELLGELKKRSSKWMRGVDLERYREFGWQRGYGVFSVNPEELEAVVEYVAGQEKHHEGQTFEEEYLKMLEEYGVAYDERYVWD